jgi:hypothetical protein
MHRLSSQIQARPVDYSATDRKEDMDNSTPEELLAEYAHTAWAGWMRYLFDRSVRNVDGTVTIPAPLVQRWDRQVLTSYWALPEDEKQSDRVEARKMIEIMRGQDHEH